MNKVAVYGSLRKDEYNYTRFRHSFGPGINYIKTIEIEGFDLYSLGQYPGIIKGDNKLIVDILKVTEEVGNVIDGMEYGAGYISEMINVEGDLVKIYIYDGSVDSEKLVESGDWSEYINSRSLETIY
jgi:gamma-glutamylcyclotransferase (GGCT)/AIG2-like uncharacterized protein YtfP